MNSLRIASTLFAGAVALAVAPCQVGVSMTATTTIGTVGYACEPFSCLPNQSLAGLGEAVRIEIFGCRESPYVLFAGWPVVGCQPFPGLTGELALWLPATLEIGAIGNEVAGYPCDTDMVVTQVVVPTATPLGMQFRLQAIALSPSDSGLGFTRAVEIHTR